MVEFEVEGQPVAKCKKPRENERRCYAVKVCIEKNPSRKRCGGRKLEEEEYPYSPCPPPPSLPPLRCNNPVVCFNCQPAVPPCPKERSKKCNKTRKVRAEQECQTDCCRRQKKEQHIQCNLAPKALPPPPPKCCTQDSQCQTSRKEMKHCGHQFSPICCEKCTIHCQTELDRGCNAVGVAHNDKQVCGKPCCKKAAAKCNVEKKDACCNTTKLNNNTAGTCNKSCPVNNQRKKRGNCNRPNPRPCPPPPPTSAPPACEQKYEFPFVGRTSSGNIKVRPSMISYENKEFGILVANPRSMRTSVKRVTSCDMIFHGECPPSFPLSPPPCPPHPFMCSPLESPEESCRTACPASLPPPPPPLRLRNKECRQCAHYQDVPYKLPELEIVEPLHCRPEPPLERRYVDRMLFIPEPVVMMDCGFEQTHVSRNKMGHAESWNYVNLTYQDGGGRERTEEVRQARSNAGNRGQEDMTKVSDKAHQTESRINNVKGRVMEATQNIKKSKGPPPNTQKAKSQYGVRREGIMETGMDVEDEEDEEEDSTEMRNTLNNSSSQSGGRPNNSGLPGARRGRSEPVTKSDVRTPPSAPAFPSEVHQIPSALTMSDSDGYHTPTEINKDNGKATNSTANLSRAVSTRSSRPQQKQSRTTPSAKNTARQQNENEEEDPKMVGKLHYVLKGRVEPDAKVAVGNAVFPVHSVVLEIRSMPPGTRPQGEDESNVKLPDFNSLPITYDGESESSPRHMDGNEDIAACSLEEKGRSKSRVVHRWQSDYSMQDRIHPSAVGSSLAFLQVEQKVVPSRLYNNARDHQQGPYDNSSSNLPNRSNSRELTSCQSCRVNSTTSGNIKSATPTRSDLRQDPDNIAPMLDSSHHHNVPERLKSSRKMISLRSKETIMRLEVPNVTTLTTHPTESNVLVEKTLSLEHLSEQHLAPKPKTSSKEIKNEEEEKEEKEEDNQHQDADHPPDSLLPNLDVIKNAILAFGGINPKLPCTKGNTGKEVYMYTRDADRWSKVGVLPHPRTHYGLARVQNDVYLIGGTDPERVDKHGKSVAVNTNLRVNLRSGKWDSLPEMDQARSHFGCAAIGENIYVIGGNIDSRATSSCQVYNTKSRQWSNIAPLDSTRSNMGIASFGSGILVVGGTSRDAKKPVLETTAFYDPTLDSWSAWKSLPSPRAFCSLAVVETRLYLIAGAGLRDIQKRRNTSLPDILNFDYSTETWMDAGMLKFPRHGHATAVLGGSIVVIAGVSSQFQGPIHSVEIWSPSKKYTSTSKAKSFRHSQSGMSVITL